MRTGRGPWAGAGAPRSPILREAPQLVGRAREVTRRGNRWETGGTRQAFDPAAFERGLTPRGRAVRDELIAAGHAEPTPADILSKLLSDRNRGV